MSKNKKKTVHASIIPSSKDSTVRKAFFQRLRNDVTIDWERKMLTNRSLALDVLYLLAISVDEKYRYHSGFMDFAKEIGVKIELESTKETVK